MPQLPPKICQAKEYFFGSSVVLGSARCAEALGQSGYDFVMIDTQHGNFAKPEAADAVRAVLLAGSVPLVRVADNQPGLINDALDGGAQGVIVPMINSAAEAARVVAAALYPPQGARSKGAGPTLLYGADYATRANQSLAVTVMIETPEAVAAADEIFAVPGVDMCLVGTSDLSFCMGCAKEGPEITAALAAVAAAGKRHGVAVGAAVHTPQGISRWLPLGVRFFLTPQDQSLLLAAAKSTAQAMNGAMAEAVAAARDGH